MKIMILGYGKYGTVLAGELVQEGHDLVIVDIDPHKEQIASERHDALVYVGNAANEDVLLEAGLGETDYLIAMTDRDDINLLACLIAKEHNVPKTITRIDDMDYYEVIKRMSSKLKIDFVINPHSAIVDELGIMINHLSATEAVEFAQGKVVYIAYHIRNDNALAGKKVHEFFEIAKDIDAVLLGVTRDGVMNIPHNQDEIKVDDVMSFICKQEYLSPLRELLGFEAKPANNIFLLGGGEVGYNLAKKMLPQHNVKIIDQDEQRCQFIAEQLDSSLVLCTDSNDAETLVNEGIKGSDVFLAATNDDQTNILGALLAERCGAKQAIAIVGRQDLMKLASSLGITACVNPRYVMSNLILENIMDDIVYNIARLQETDAEIIDFKISFESNIIGKKLKEMNIPDGIKVGSIFRGKEVILPTGEDQFNEGDHVIVLATPESLKAAESFFAKNHNGNGQRKAS